MNTVQLIGNLVRDPELSQAGETKVCRFTVACNDGYGDKQRTSYIPCQAWGRQAENIDQFLGKGSKVGVEGRLQTGSYEKDGKTIYTWVVNSSRVEFLGSKQQAQEPLTPEEMGFQAIDDDDVPF